MESLFITLSWFLSLDWLDFLRDWSLEVSDNFIFGFFFLSYPGSVTKYIHLTLAGTYIFLVLLLNFIYVTVAICI